VEEMGGWREEKFKEEGKMCGGIEKDTKTVE
jgi:hypothetical protein